MNLYIYSDESGVFDYKHEEYFIFGGIIYLSKSNRDNDIRKYLSLEKKIRKSTKIKEELKANSLPAKHKRRLFSSVEFGHKFGIIIRLNNIHKQIFDDKKSKQRYLDYAYKIGVKKSLQSLANQQILELDKINNIYFFCDEHTTATNGKYELKEALEQEFKRGTFNHDFNNYFPPIIPTLKSISLEYCNSEKTTLIRAADIIANNIYHHAMRGEIKQIRNKIILFAMP